MRVFVSYSKGTTAISISGVLSRFVLKIGQPYLDDMHHPQAGDREAAVLAALRSSDAFVMVLTDNYLRSAWTRRELQIVEEHRMPVYCLHPDDRLAKSSAAEVRRLKEWG